MSPESKELDDAIRVIIFGHQPTPLSNQETSNPLEYPSYVCLHRNPRTPVSWPRLPTLGAQRVVNRPILAVDPEL